MRKINSASTELTAPLQFTSPMSLPPRRRKLGGVAVGVGAGGGQLGFADRAGVGPVAGPIGDGGAIVDAAFVRIVGRSKQGWAKLLMIVG